MTIRMGSIMRRTASAHLVEIDGSEGKRAFFMGREGNESSGKSLVESIQRTQVAD